MVQVIEKQSKEEKTAMYMKLRKSELIDMLIKREEFGVDFKNLQPVITNWTTS